MWVIVCVFVGYCCRFWLYSSSILHSALSGFLSIDWFKAACSLFGVVLLLGFGEPEQKGNLVPDDTLLSKRHGLI